MKSDEMSVFAKTITDQKYAHELKDGQKETWPEIANRVAKTVLKSVNAPKSLIEQCTEYITERKFIPGGRYLYASGRPFHQVNNCLLFRAEDSREGWADHMHKSAMGLMTGAGIGTDYSAIRPEGKLIRKTGGFARGPLGLMSATNEYGRETMQGGSRRSALWAGLNWNHADVMKFIVMKNWIKEVRDMKARDFNFPAMMDMTNISVQLDDDFFEAYNDDKNALHSHAQMVYWAVIERMLKTGEPGFSIDTGKNAKETLRNAPICAGTHVLTNKGYVDVGDIVETPVTLWTGKQWAENVTFRETEKNAHIVTVAMSGGRQIRCDKLHPFLVERYKGAGKNRKLVKIERVFADMLKPGDVLHVSLPEAKENDCNLQENAYALGYVYGDGSFTNGKAEITFCTDESKVCSWTCREAEHISSVTEKDKRGYTRIYFKTDHAYFDNRDKAVFPTELYGFSKVYAGSFLAGLFDADGNYEPTQKRIRLASIHEGFLRGVARLLEQHGILSGVSKAGISTYGKSQGYQLVVMSEYNQKFADFVPTIRLKPNLDEYKPYRDSLIKVLSVEEDGYEPVYCADVHVPEHSFMAEGVIISNCTEITSADDSDVCNLGSINLARIESLEEMTSVTECAIAFLCAGTVYSDVPYSKVDQVRTKNRRLGLGLMGIHEWLVQRGKKYAQDAELDKYLEIYATSGKFANQWAAKWDLSKPVKTRAIAPTGTIGILGETSTGLEPLFCVAYKRRYLKGGTWNYQYVLDPTAKRLIENGANPDNVEDAYTLAEDVERRLAFQAHVQKYVDHGISSTINLPAWGSELNNSDTVQKFGKVFMKYLPSLRGLTTYPDGARSGQPLSPVRWATAIKHVGEVFTEASDICEISGKGGSCGS